MSGREFLTATISHFFYTSEIRLALTARKEEDKQRDPDDRSKDYDEEDYGKHRWAFFDFVIVYLVFLHWILQNM